MPPLARMVVPALEDLARQLRFAPREALLRDIDRAEALAASINADAAYDEAWIVGQVTGYQARLDSPATIVGSALLSDLSPFVERLCESAGLTPADLPPGSLAPDALAARWSVSRKTLDRYRKRGLVARRVIGPDAKVRLAFAPGVIDAFQAREHDAIDRAAGFSRISDADEARIIRRAARYRARFNCSLNEAAKRLATRFGRSHEAIRQILRRHDAALPAPQRLFTRPGPPDERFERLAWRVWRRALDPGTLAQRNARSRVAVVRAANHHRAALLRGLAPTLTRAPLPVHLLDRDLDRILASPPATTGLGGPAITEALHWILTARGAGAPLGVEERSRTQGYHVIRARVASLTAALGPSTPEAERLDEAETLLRWAARLKAELIRAQQGLVLRALESRLARPLEEVRAAELAELVMLSVRAIADAIDTYDAFGVPGKLPGRLAAPAGLAIDRAVARWQRDHAQQTGSRPRATPRLSPDAQLPDWTTSICAWQAWTEPDPRVRLGAASLPEADRRFLLRRFGWDDGPPTTLERIAAEFNITRIAVVGHERALIRAALAAAGTARA